MLINSAHAYKIDSCPLSNENKCDHCILEIKKNDLSDSSHKNEDIRILYGEN